MALGGREYIAFFRKLQSSRIGLLFEMTQRVRTMNEEKWPLFTSLEPERDEKLFVEHFAKELNAFNAKFAEFLKSCPPSAIGDIEKQNEKK